MQQYIYETVTWVSKEDVTDATMIEAVTKFGETIKKLPGFLHQALYKQSQNKWLDVYYWKTKEHAKQSNEAVSGDPNFLALIDLIEPDSIEMNIYAPIQQAGSLHFKLEPSCE